MRWVGDIESDCSVGGEEQEARQLTIGAQYLTELSVGPLDLIGGFDAWKAAGLASTVPGRVGAKGRSSA